MLSPKTIARCFYQAVYDTIYHDGIEHAGYLAFMALLSLFPFLVFFVAIVGSLGETEIGLRLIKTILENNLIPANILPAIKIRVEEIASGPPQGLLTLAIVGAIWTASSMVDGLRTILNRAYRVSTPPAYIWRRLTSIGEFFVLTAMVAAVTFLLIIAPNLWFSLKPVLHLEHIHLHELTAGLPWDYLRYSFSTLVLFFVVSAMYIILPNTKQSWTAVAPGALVVVILWFITGSLFSGYLSRFDQVHVIYGSLGGIIAFLLFFYFTAMIFIFGAELNYLLERAQGHKIEEKEPIQMSLL